MVLLTKFPYISQDQMAKQLENIQVLEWYSDPEFNSTAPNNLHSTEILCQSDPNSYTGMCMSTMTYHIKRLIDSYNCAIL